MSLKDAIEEVLSYADDPPPNESNTCEWVILPLLWAAGYARREIISRIADNNGQFPDYTVLPSTPECTWYAEAKAWNVALEDRHAQQSLNYANQNGKRWVVLTNGRVWRLYDNRIQGLAADKLIAETHLTDLSAFTEFLTSVGKTSVCSGGLERYAIKARLAPLLNTQLQKPDSEIIRGLRNLLKNQTGLSDVQNGDIAAYFQEILASRPPDTGEVVAEPKSVEPPPTADPSQSLDALFQAVKTQGRQVVSGTKPQSILFPDSASVQVKDWSELEVAVVQWLGSRKELPVPFNIGMQSNLLDSTPDGMKRHGRLDFAWGTVYVNTNSSAPDKIARLYSLCQAVGEEPSLFILQLR